MMSRRRIFSLLLLVPFLTGFQQPDIRVDVEAVNVLVTVTDRNGRFVTDLPRERFQVFEDGVPQEITFFSHQTDLPLSLGLLIDSSSSVRLQMDFQKEVATNFLFSVMRSQDRALLVEFDSGIHMLHDFTSRPAELAQALQELRAGGGTALFDALYTVSRDKMLGGEERKSIILLSDGEDTNSAHGLEETLEIVLEAGVIVYTIGTNRFGPRGRRSGERTLEKLARETGGLSFFPSSHAELREAFEWIDTELRSQYNLAYVPSRPAADGKFREIRVRLNNGRGLQVRHRSGYYPRPTEATLGFARPDSVAGAFP